jgi:mannose-1-phosphate guanylyltransferase/mannose-6-phosphate isomerase
MENKKFLDLNINTKQSKTERPWGSYEILCKGAGYQSKRLTINSGQRLSLQTHKHRDEQWVIAKGTAKVTIGDKVLTLGKGQSAEVPRTIQHRIENISDIDSLEIIEVQIGDYIDEEDIIRLEDDYGR